MAKYKILVIAHQLKNKVIAKYGDVVDETQLMGNAPQLEKEGFIELVKEVKTEIKDIEVKDPKKVSSKK